MSTYELRCTSEQIDLIRISLDMTVLKISDIAESMNKCLDDPSTDDSYRFALNTVLNAQNKIALCHDLIAQIEAMRGLNGNK